MLKLIKKIGKRVVYKNWPGYCPICEKRVRFFAHGKWYREELRCGTCRSIPRERALMRVIQTIFPGWRTAAIHESSPANRGVSPKMLKECRNYIGSQYLPEKEPGSVCEDGYVAQDLEAQTFADSSFDLVITQDVFEHIF